MSTLSLVITSYNHKDYLIEAIESALAQTMRPHQIIVADDGSSDGSVAVIREYERRHPDLVTGVYQSQNVGIPRNRNAALEQVTGNWVAVLDGDDIFLPQFVEQISTTIDDHPDCGCVYTNYKNVDPHRHLIDLRYENPMPEGYVFSDVAQTMFGIMRSMAVDYRLLQQIGFMDPRFPKYDGYELTLRLAKHTQFAYIHEPLVDYRVHPNSDSSSLNADDHIRDLSGIYKKMQPLLKDLPPQEQRQIREHWRDYLDSWRIRNAEEKGHMLAEKRLRLQLKSRRLFRRGRGKIRRLVSRLAPAFAIPISP